MLAVLRTAGRPEARPHPTFVSELGRWALILRAIGSFTAVPQRVRCLAAA